MKVYRELDFKLKSLNNDQFIDILKQFTQQQSDWIFMKEERTPNDTPSCYLQLKDAQNDVVFYISNNSKGSYCVGNIFFLQGGQLSMSEYNLLLKRFVDDFRSFMRQHKISIDISITSDEIGLDKIILGKKRDSSLKHI